ncbi:MAG: hypothetical protein M0Z43_11280 [Acidithiobacillus sp.]|nr:hypothetical protein [Acidithiobacillus sp.]
MAGDDAVTWADLDKRCEGCRRLSDANQLAMTATVKQCVQEAISTQLRGMIPISVLWTNKLESAGLGAVFVAFLGLLVYVATH